MVHERHLPPDALSALGDMDSISDSDKDSFGDHNKPLLEIPRPKVPMIYADGLIGYYDPTASRLKLC